MEQKIEYFLIGMQPVCVTFQEANGGLHLYKIEVIDPETKLPKINNSYLAELEKGEDVQIISEEKFKELTASPQLL